MATKNKNEKLGLFILRVGMGSFLMLWGLDKLFAPDSTVKVFEWFYKIPIGVSAAQAIGVLEILLGLAIITALWKRYTYGLGLILHSISVGASWKQMIDPFGKNHLFIAGLPVLAGFIALYMLRDKDTLLSIDDRK